VDDYFMGDGSGGRRTQKLGVHSLYQEIGLEEWYDPQACRIVYDRLASLFSADQIFVSQRGFAPTLPAE
jgi:hypothetical protein